MKNKIYLAGPICGLSNYEVFEWRRAFTKTLGDQYECLDPTKRDYRGIEAANVNEIVVLDKRDIASADALVVMFTRPSVGTSMEVFYAHSIGKPVLLLNLSKNNLSPWLVYHATAVVESIDAAVESLNRWFI